MRSLTPTLLSLSSLQLSHSIRPQRILDFWRVCSLRQQSLVLSFPLAVPFSFLHSPPLQPFGTYFFCNMGLKRRHHSNKLAAYALFLSVFLMGVYQLHRYKDQLSSFTYYSPFEFHQSVNGGISDPYRLTDILHQYEQTPGLNNTLFMYIQDGTRINGTTPTLVVCDTINPALTPMFSNFSLVRLKNNEAPPPWGEIVFLDPSGCEDHTYVKQARERREKSGFVVHERMSADESGAWVHGVHWPNFSTNSTKYLRAVIDRPFIIAHWGEVFWRTLYEKKSCDGVDMVVYRGVENYGMNCLTMHFLQGVSSALAAKDELEGQVLPTSIKHDKFCSMIVKTNPYKPTSCFTTSLYDIDSIVRLMFFLQLSEYEPCTRIVHCTGGPYTSFECMKGYKFHITMVSELKFNILCSISVISIGSTGKFSSRWVCFREVV